jgi:hypothetical protein
MRKQCGGIDESGTMSQAAHNKIAAAQRARWAKTRAQEKKAA